MLVEDGNTARADVPPLFGRQEILDAATASFDEVLRSETPGLFTIVGDHGLGKSRMSHEIEARLVRAHPEVYIVSLGSGRQADVELDAIEDQLAAILRTVGGSASSAVRRIDSRVLATGDDTAAEAYALGRALRRVATRVPLAVLIDDVHYADDATLEALEYAALDGANTRLWIAVTTHPRFERRRPQWGQRVLRHDRVVLDPLAEGEAMDLAAALLHPVEYPPRATLERIARWTAGNPQALVALVDTLVQTGIVRQGRQDGSWYIATAELERLPASPVGQWLAGRTLAAVPDDVAACARICTVLGLEFQRDELEWLQNAAERVGVASTPVDSDVGLAALAHAGLLHEVRPGWWRFSRASFQDAVYKLIDRRDRTRLHQLALGFWQTQGGLGDPERTLEAIARHAEGAGDGTIAARAYLELGTHAQARGRDIDADRYYTLALHACPSDLDPLALESLRGRGRARYRLHRMQDAIDDLERAGVGAEAIEDEALHADLLLEQATALDWAEKHEASARCVERAGALIDRLDRPVLRGRHQMALGRSAYRAGRFAEAIERLGGARALANAHGDDDTRIVAMLLLGPLYVLTEKLDEAERIFDEALELCRVAGDRFHLCVGYNNRSYLWLAKKSMQGIMADLGRSREIAREAGWLVLERASAHNLAEFLHWSGAQENALELARRACSLQRFLPDPVPANAILLARILAASDRGDEARQVVADTRRLLGDQATNDIEALLLQMLDLFLTKERENQSQQWADLVSSARNILPDEEFLEVLYFRGLAAVYAQRWQELAETLAEARERLPQAPIWKGNFTTLEVLLPTHEIPVGEPTVR